MCPDCICRTKVFRESCLDLSEGDIVEVIAGLDWTSRFYFKIILTVKQSVSLDWLVWQMVGQSGSAIGSSTGGGGWFYGRIISNSGVDWRLDLHEHVCLYVTFLHSLRDSCSPACTKVPKQVIAWATSLKTVCRHLRSEELANMRHVAAGHAFSIARVKPCRSVKANGSYWQGICLL